jgi:hypothetical protein
MKRRLAIIGLVLATLLIGAGTIMASTSQAQAAQAHYWHYGDANLDGETNAGDITYTFRLIMGLSPQTIANVRCADTNGDGVVNMGDVVVTTRYIMGITPLPEWWIY